MSAPGSFDIARAAEKVGDDEPHAWIQWKGTDVCMDIRCPCGELGHIDGLFAYQIKCSACGQHYAVGTNVVLAPMTEEQVAYAKGLNSDVVFIETI